MKMLKKRGPGVDSSGTLDSTETGEENFPNVWTEEDLFDKQLWNQITKMKIVKND
jgi:hypothetical protein